HEAEGEAAGEPGNGDQDGKPCPLEKRRQSVDHHGPVEVHDLTSILRDDGDGDERQEPSDGRYVPAARGPEEAITSLAVRSRTTSGRWRRSGHRRGWSSVPR